MRISFRKIIITVVVITMSLIVSAYSSKTSIMSNLKEKLFITTIVDDAYIQPPYASLDKLLKQYGYELAVKNGDVVGRWDVAYNFEKMDNFYKAYQNKTLKNGDMIRIVIYTFEGDPIIKDLIFTGDGFDLIIDTTRDTYGSKEIVEHKLSNIFTKPNGKYTKYIGKTKTNQEIYLI